MSTVTSLRLGLILSAAGLVLGTTACAANESAQTYEAAGPQTATERPAPAGKSKQPGNKAGKKPGVLSGNRKVTMVRVGAFESGLSLLDDRGLAEVDDDRGRQEFVLTPLADGSFLIKAYGESAVCWQERNPRTTQPLTVVGAACDKDSPAQRFTLTAGPDGKSVYAISNRSAFLAHSPRHGLILEETGDAPATYFRLNDTGPAPAGA
jgi:hypothetical protein